MRIRRLTVALVAAPLTVTLLAACAPVPRPAVITAAAVIAPSAGLRTAEAAPMSTVESVGRAIVANVTVPATGVGRVSRVDATSAVEWLGTYLAQAHGDPRWLCATETTASPSKRYATTALLRRFGAKDGERVRRGLEPRLTEKAERDCGGVDWVAPGVAVGPQQLTLEGGRGGDDLRVVYQGRFGYRLVAKGGWEQPWGGDYRATYGLVQHGKEWRLNSVPAWWHSVGPAWPDPLPLPAAFAEKATAPALPGADGASLTAVRAAVRDTLATPAATWRYSEGVEQQGALSTSWAIGSVSFARGDALIQHESRGTRLYLDDGRTDLTRLKKPVTPVPGESMPPSPQWRSTDPTKRALLLPSVDDASPFVNLAVAGLADAAANTSCAPGAVEVRADRCYTVRVPVSAAAYGDGITARFGWGHLALGHVWITMDLGTDGAGRLVYLHRRLAVSSMGQESSRVEVTGTLTGFTDQRPVEPPRPAAQLVARDGTFFHTD
ncbi:hypothetical protein [Micromonospora sp. NPDC049679]|uniref:hypothetical protein n=1 Tax=Micromonospora sp. NPDC049679 TaxID=3155920 RepID=UPI0033FFE2DF